MKKKIFRKMVAYLVAKKPEWINSLIKEAVFNRGFVPRAVTDRQYFSAWEKKGVHISQNHFYHPLPDLSALDENYWKEASAMGGINANLSSQILLLKEITERYAEEFNALPVHKAEVANEWEYFIQNGNFTSVDGELLYCMIRKFQPAKIIEVGSGYSTFMISKALEVNKKIFPSYQAHFTAIEPFPRDLLNVSIPSLNSMLKQSVQQTDLSVFEKLAENDILFIDSTHVMKYGSDVEFEIFKIMPVLKKGVIIHFHDIFLPKNYPEKWVRENGWFWNEQQFLQSFLMFNDSFEILFSNSMMHHFHPELLQDTFSSYSNAENPGSLWLRKIK